MSRFYAQTSITQKSVTQKITYFPDRGCVHTLLPLYVYATVPVSHISMRLFPFQTETSQRWLSFSFNFNRYSSHSFPLPFQFSANVNCITSFSSLPVQWSFVVSCRSETKIDTLKTIRCDSQWITVSELSATIQLFMSLFLMTTNVTITMDVAFSNTAKGNHWLSMMIMQNWCPADFQEQILWISSFCKCGDQDCQARSQDMHV